MRSLTDYILGLKTNFKYKLKFAFSLDECQFDAIERALRKYDVTKISNITRTPIEKNPKDFPTISHSEIFIIDIETDMPISTTVAQQDIHQYAKIPMDCILVCDLNTMYKEYEQELLDAQSKKYVAKIGDPDYSSDGSEPVDLHSEKYNQELVKAAGEHSVNNPTIIGDEADNKELSDNVTKVGNMWKNAIKQFRINDFR